MRLFTPRMLIAVALYEVIFSPLLLAVTPGPPPLRWLLGIGFGLGVVALGLGLGVSLLRNERRR